MRAARMIGILAGAGLISALGLGVMAGEARAEAPQALGVIASNGPDALVCRDAECVLIASSFCLEEHRRAPIEGTAYHAAPGTEITLAMTMADGTVTRMPADGLIEPRTGRHYTQMQFVLPRAKLAELGAVAAGVEVGANATFLPTPGFRTGTPHSAEEVAMLSGPVRKAANLYFEGGRLAGEQASLLAELLSSFPAMGGGPSGLREAAWSRAQSKAARQGFSPAAVEGAREVLDDCTGLVDQGRIAAEATCIDWRQRELQIRTNKEFWNGLTGS